MSDPSTCGATWPEDPNLACLRSPGHLGAHFYEDPPVGHGGVADEGGAAMSDTWPRTASIWGGKVDPLVGKVVQLPDPAEALVLSIENEYDDGTTLRYLTGPQAGTLTQRDTFSVREYEVLR